MIPVGKLHGWGLKRSPLIFSTFLGYGSNPGRGPWQSSKEACAWQRTIGLGCKMGARTRTSRVLDKTKRVVGSILKLDHVQNMNRPLTIVQNMLSICPKRYGMNVPILVYHCWTNFDLESKQRKVENLYALCIFRPGFDPYSLLSTLGGQIGRSKGPCDAFHPWVRWERGQVGI